MSDEMIVEFCSPTLAGIKTGNLFTCGYHDYDVLVKDLRRLNGVLGKKGIKLVPLRYLNHRALIYVFRPTLLKKDLCDKDTAMLLEKLGYDVKDVNSCISCLKKKLEMIKTGNEFPHEIGLFLSYPIEDVKGFMKHKGECSKCIGCWKVYDDVMKAEDTFDRYKRCTNDYVARIRKGVRLEELVVCA